MKILLISTAVLLAAACNGAADLGYVAMNDPNILDPTHNPDNGVDPTAMACDFGYTYDGFGGTRLEAGRAHEDIGFDRDRVKPYSALAGEFARVLGAPAPALLAQLSSTVGHVPPPSVHEPPAQPVSN